MAYPGQITQAANGNYGMDSPDTPVTIGYASNDPRAVSASIMQQTNMPRQSLSSLYGYGGYQQGSKRPGLNTGYYTPAQMNNYRWGNNPRQSLASLYNSVPAGQPITSTQNMNVLPLVNSALTKPRYR